MKKVSVISRHPSHKNFEFPLFNKSVRVRFGSTTLFPSRKFLEFPSIDAIKKASNKISMKECFMRHGVSTPSYGVLELGDLIKLKINEIPSNLEHLFKYSDVELGGVVVPKFELIFKEKNHSRGEGIMFISDNASLIEVCNNRKAGYVEEVVGNDREFRVHVFNGDAFYVDEKRPRERGHVARIKNLANGYKYREPRRDYPDNVKAEAIKAAESIGITFGAVDISLSSDGTVNVFEINSAPGLRSRTRKLYNQKIIEYIKSNGITEII